MEGQKTWNRALPLLFIICGIITKADNTSQLEFPDLLMGISTYPSREAVKLWELIKV